MEGADTHGSRQCSLARRPEGVPNGVYGKRRSAAERLARCSTSSRSYECTTPPCPLRGEQKEARISGTRRELQHLGGASLTNAHVGNLGLDVIARAETAILRAQRRTQIACRRTEASKLRSVLAVQTR